MYVKRKVPNKKKKAVRGTDNLYTFQVRHFSGSNVYKDLRSNNSSYRFL